jgi:hypothetical protein
MPRGIVRLTWPEIELIKNLVADLGKDNQSDTIHKLVEFTPAEPKSADYAAEFTIEDAEMLMDRIHNGDVDPNFHNLKFGLRNKLLEFYTAKRENETDEVAA